MTGRRCNICGKRCYGTQEAALRIAARASARRNECRAYYVHGWWHLTSSGQEI
jgi:hypothetical protein